MLSSPVSAPGSNRLPLIRVCFTKSSGMCTVSAMGRDAYLFVAAVERAGHVAATLYLLIGTCKLNRIEPYAYLKGVLQRVPSHPVHRLAQLLPFN